MVTLTRVIGLALIACVGAPSLAAAEPKIAVLSTQFVLARKFERMQEISRQHGVHVVYVRVDAASAADIAHALDGADFILLDMPRQEDQALVERMAGDQIRARGVPTFSVMPYSPPHTMGGVGLDAEAVRTLYDYYANGTHTNVVRMLQYIKRRLLNVETGEVLPPVLLPAQGIWHPDSEEVFPSLHAYRDWLAARAPSLAGAKPPVIGVEIASSYLADGQTRMLEDWVQRIEAAGAVPLLFFRRSRGSRPAGAGTPAGSPPVRPGRGAAPDASAPPFTGRGSASTGAVPTADQVGSSPLASVDGLLTENGEPFVDVVVNLMFLGSNPDARRAEYEALGVPALQTLAYREGDFAAYLEDRAGVPIHSLPFTLTIAEYVGLVDPMVDATNEKGELVPIDAHVDAVVRKALNLVALQRKPNADKRVALFVWNTPPGEKNTSASNLNVPRSIERLARRLQASGYSVPAVRERELVEAFAAMQRPAYRPNALHGLIAEGRAAALPIDRYKTWFAALPAHVRAEVEAYWGAPEKSPWVTTIEGEQAFVIPRFEIGNLLVMPQPLRGEAANDGEEKLSHDTRIPLNHFYMAVYLWVREQFLADAIVHFGTHGTQEWTPGKERGLSMADYPNILVGDTPVIYPYIVDNVAEALQVKRRGRGVVISHQTPPFAPAGVPGDLVAITDRVREYAQLDDGPVRRRIRDEILDHAGRMKILEDLDWSAQDAQARFDAFRQELHTYLDELSSHVQPLGLHTLGEPASGEHLASTIMQMLGRPLYEALNLTPAESSFSGDYRELKSTKPYQFVERYVINGHAAAEPDDPALARFARLGRDHLSRLRDMSELDAVLAALDGRHVRTSTGGDPIRSPEALPTGRNLFGFDPSRVPTPSAYEAGRQAVEELVREYRRTHEDRFPQKLTFSLWSTETMRHLGMLEGQILAAIGARPVWDDGGRVTGIEVVPSAELGRPRVDAVVSITGLYRDQFPNVIEWLNLAIGKVAALDEPDNIVRHDTEKVRDSLLARQVPADLADEFSKTRIFGNESGDYGTRLPDATLASGQWEGDAQLAELYLSRMSWAYGPNPEHWSTKLAGEDGCEVNAYAEHLRGTSAAVFSRSSNLNGLLDTDHPFEYLGGISLAVRHLDGVSPQLYISNMRDPSRTALQTAERFLATDLRTTYQHPGWVAEMKLEGYAGTLALANAVNNFWGWSAVDRTVVRDDQWQAFHDVYVNDRYELGLREWFERANPAALASIAERMLEAVRKGHWNTDARTVRELARTYTDLSERYGVASANAKFRAYAAAHRGFGLHPGTGTHAATAHPESAAAAPAPAAARASAVVRGQLLRPVPARVVAERLAWRYGAIVLVMMLAGALWQARRQRNERRVVATLRIRSAYMEEE